MASTLKQSYEDKRGEITDFCKQHNMKMVELEDAFHICTDVGSWKLTEDALFHKNNTRGYHRQHVEFDSIFEYLAYIADHDAFRKENPVYNRKDANQSPHVFKPAQKYRKQLWRKSELRNIFDCMDGIRQYQFA